MIYYLTKEKLLFEDSTEINYTDNFDLLLDYFKNKKLIAFDTETTGFDPYVNKILLYQLGDKDIQFVVNPDYFPVTLVKELLERPDCTTIMQNAKFDLGFLYQYSVIPYKVYDTYLAEAVLFTGIKSARKSLEHLAMKYCNVKLDKSVRKAIHYEGRSTRVIKYAAGDVAYLHEIMQKQRVDLSTKDLHVALELDNLFVKVLAYVEHCGIYLNINLWKEKMTKDTAELQESKELLDKWIVDNQYIEFIDSQLDLFNPERTCNINWSSSHQVVPLMKKLGVDTVVTDEKTGNPKDSIEAPILKRQEHKSELISVYLRFKAADKRVTTYGQNYLNVVNPVTSRIHSSFNQILSTGRMSCGGKQEGKQLVNLQNVPREEETRSCFTNQFPDTTLVNADYNSQESVMFTNLSQEPNLIKFYNERLGDMHSYLASKLFPELAEVSLKEIKTKHSEKRYAAKTAGFAILYGGTGVTIAENANIPVEQGEEVYKNYLKAFPGFEKYAQTVENAALKRGHILFNEVSRRKSFIPYFSDFKSLEHEVNIKGFWETYRWHKEKDTTQFKEHYKPLVRRYFKKKGEIRRLALNYPIQGSGAEVTKLAGTYLFDYILENNLFNIVKISNLVHDEILCECPKDKAEELSKTLKECMERAGDKFCKTIKLEATPKITTQWEH